MFFVAFIAHNDTVRGCGNEQIVVGHIPDTFQMYLLTISLSKRTISCH